MATILHLSDLHFGEEIATTSRDCNLLNCDEGAILLAKSIHDRLAEEDNDDFSLPDCILVTGDITNKAKEHEFDLSEIFFQSLLDQFKLDKDRLIVIPGNHDVSWDVKSDDEKKYSGFKHFYERFFETSWEPEVPINRHIINKDTLESFIIFGFNSCSVENKIWSGLGYVGEQQFKNAREWLMTISFEEQSSIKLAALHHHVLPVFNYHPIFKDFDPLKGKFDGERLPVSLLLNASQLTKKCRQLNVSTIFHGHSHTPFSARFTNFIDNELRDSGEQESRSISIIGAGSPSSESQSDYIFKQFQIVSFSTTIKPTFYHIRGFKTLDGERTIKETKQTNAVVPGGHAVYEVPPESLSQLRDSLYQTFKDHEIHIDKEGDIDTVIHAESVYDSMLSKIVIWLDSHRIRSFGHAVIAKFMPSINAYINVALYRYVEDVRQIVYDMNESSITTECAHTGEVQNITSRKNSKIASTKRNDLYKKTIGGKDQVCLAVPLNSMIKKYPYAVLGFARPKDNKSSVYNSYDIALVDRIKGIIEESLKQAEIFDVAMFRQRLSHLNNWIVNLSSDNNSDVSDILELIADRIYDTLRLSKDHSEAFAIFLPKPPKFKEAYAVVERGFGKIKAEEMLYKYNDKNQGLTGGVLNSRKFDFSIDHLNKTKEVKSFRGIISSKKCQKKITTKRDHLLSFVGVPLGGNENNYNQGAIVLNIATPISQIMNIGGPGNESALPYMKSKFIEPLTGIAQSLNIIIEGKWKEFCQEKKIKKN